MQIQDELMPLFQQAWDEVDFLSDHMNLDPDWETIATLDKLGMFRTYTAREEGVLIGYMCVIIQKLLHSRSNYHANVDVAYIKPEHRGNFKTFLRLIESDLKEQGVKTFTFNLKDWDSTGEFLKRNEYEHVENVYIKVMN